MTPEVKNKLSKWIATAATPEIYILFREMGFTNVGELVDHIATFKKEFNIKC